MLPVQKKPLALSMGEPAGIGPDITLAAWKKRKPAEAFVYIGSSELLRTRAGLLGVDVAIENISDISEAGEVFKTALPVLDLPLPGKLAAGRPDPQNAPAIIRSIEMAARLTISGQTAALVTNPIHKKLLYDAGFAFPGHTEYLGQLAGQGGAAIKPVMMLACPGLRVVPVTVHIALSKVAGELSTDLIVETAIITHRDLIRKFAITAPRLAIAGLNPHAGEGGAMGNEEELVIAPAIARLQEMGIDVFGPCPPDTMFHEDARKGYDAALCMYHDQALIPIKTLDFHNGVNITLGLPFLRTSPDHGTALDLAGSGSANPSSLIAAMAMARGAG